jgi:hypothetical protein
MTAYCIALGICERLTIWRFVSPPVETISLPSAQ